MSSIEPFLIQDGPPSLDRSSFRWIQKWFEHKNPERSVSSSSIKVPRCGVGSLHVQHVWCRWSSRSLLRNTGLRKPFLFCQVTVLWRTPKVWWLFRLAFLSNVHCSCNSKRHVDEASGFTVLYSALCAWWMMLIIHPKSLGVQLTRSWSKVPNSTGPKM